MEFSVDEIGDCNFTIEEFHQTFFPVNFDISFIEIFQYSENKYSTFPTTLRQLPYRSNNNLAY